MNDRNGNSWTLRKADVPPGLVDEAKEAMASRPWSLLRPDDCVLRAMRLRMAAFACTAALYEEKRRGLKTARLLWKEVKEIARVMNLLARSPGAAPRDG